MITQVYLVFSGKVKVRNFCNSKELTIQTMQQQPVADSMPAKVAPAGMTRDRRKYLHKEIREFCKEECRDLVCPGIN